MGTINPFREENWHIFQYYVGKIHLLSHFPYEGGTKKQILPNITLESGGQIFNIFPFYSPVVMGFRSIL